MKPTYSLDDLRCFCAVAQLGSFKQAANHLGMPLSTLSRRISQLEQNLQLRLLNRDAHRVSLTHTGEQYFQRSSSLFEELSDIDEDLHQEKHQPKGKIRITAPINAGAQFLQTIFYDFLLQYPDIKLDLSFSNALTDIEAAAVDVAFRVGNPALEHWIIRPLKQIHFILCCHPEHPSYNITQPQQLCAHSTVICRPMIPWQLVHKASGEEFNHHPIQSVRLEVNEILLMTNAVKAGLGIGYIPDYFALPMIERGEIKQVLPEWRSQARTLSMLYRDRNNLPLRVRLLVDFVLQHFDKPKISEA
ncbi:LysR family transcriptional regulator [Agarivorans sp. Z349TD_8]|uniref:LysR family transcriptional regulator n=1 Tax=Agarivorans sp. Z349TD_8 TaxID=3421434 RepID=UPI003D7C82D9